MSTSFLSQPSKMSPDYSSYRSYIENFIDPTKAASYEGKIQTSIALFLITLAAGEVLIFVLCKVLAWYAHVAFYAQQGDMDWIHESDSNTPDQSNYVDNNHEPSLQDIQRALCTHEYSPDDANSRISLDNEVCPICLGDFEHGEVISSGKTCHHQFHNSCITEWLSKRTSCPCCRRGIMDVVISSKRAVPEVPSEIPEPAYSLSWIFRYRDPTLDPAFCLFIF